VRDLRFQVTSSYNSGPRWPIATFDLRYDAEKFAKGICGFGRSVWVLDTETLAEHVFIRSDIEISLEKLQAQKSKPGIGGLIWRFLFGY